MKILIIQNREEILNPMLQLNENHTSIIKKQFPDAEITVVDDVKDEIDTKIDETEIIITSRLHNIDFQKTENLKWIHVTAAGVDFLSDDLLNSDVLITNSSGVHSIPIAEHVFAFMLMFERQIHKSFRIQVEEKKWVRNFKFQNVSELHGKTIGIIGLGRIGRKIAQLAKAFDMKVLAIVRNPREEKNVDEMYDMKGLDNVLETSDYVVVCLPLTKETQHLFDYEKFSKMKSSTYFINIGRGKIVKENDLIKALKDNIIAGAGLDVFEDEPLPDDSELWNLENVIITPHYSGWTPYYMDRVVDIFCENMKAFLEGRRMPNLVDKDRKY
ncbi:MAG: D-2-hydroxyacid dehydrogenase [Candidatus Aenigmarchaeota archaeon]|nr:D-2-hydroxyacid dehydrogenase [Candidatus Aenigmarchaeota archaeon]